MTAGQRLSLEQSRIRERLNELLGRDELSEEERGELDQLTSRAQEVEVELRAAIVAEDGEQETTSEGTAEDRGLVELRSRASVGEIVGAAIETRATTGATKELQDELGLNANQVPLDLLVEHRASTVTAAPTDGEETSQRIVPAIFPDSVAGFLGVDQPRVPVGVASWHVLSTNLTANTPAAGAAGANTAAAFTSYMLESGRVQGAFVVRREDVARFPGMESALRENLSSVLMDKLDEEILNGSGGLLNDGLTQPSVPGSTVDFDGYTDLVAERVDGLYASTTGSVRLLVGAKTYQHAIKQYRAATADGPSALQYLMDLAGGVRVGYHVAAPPASGGRASVQDVLAARATGLVHMVQPVWEGPTAVVDPYTRADEGEIVVTLVGLFAQKIVRTDGFARLAVKLA